MDIVIRDKEFIKKVDYLKKSNGYKSRLETITKIIEERCEDERPSDCPNCKHYKDGYCDIWERKIDEEMWCTGFENRGKTCKDCPYIGTDNCELWYANGSVYSCRGVRDGIIELPDLDDDEAST